MCVDFTSLNIAFSKDSYHVPNIDWLIDESPGYKIEFHGRLLQILPYWIDIVDVPKTTLTFNHGNYYCNIMSFKLKNADATYEKLMDAVISK